MTQTPFSSSSPHTFSFIFFAFSPQFPEKQTWSTNTFLSLPSFSSKNEKQKIFITGWMRVSQYVKCYHKYLKKKKQKVNKTSKYLFSIKSLEQFVIRLRVNNLL